MFQSDLKLVMDVMSLNFQEGAPKPSKGQSVKCTMWLLWWKSKILLEIAVLICMQLGKIKQNIDILV